MKISISLIKHILLQIFLIIFTGSPFIIFIDVMYMIHGCPRAAIYSTGMFLILSIVVGIPNILAGLL